VAARLQPLARHRLRHRVTFATIALGALAAPASAQAHSGAPVSALDYKAQVVSIGPRAASVDANVLDGDRKLHLSADGSRTILVLGDADEPFLRLSSSGVEVNDRSPTAIANRLALKGSVPALTANASPSWRIVSHGHSYAWHDHRLGPLPGHRYRNGDVTRWAIPIVVDGRRDRIVGRLSYAAGPSIWPWLALLGVARVVAAALAGRRSRPRVVGMALVGGAALAGPAAVVLSVGVSLVPGQAASAAWESILIACAISAAAIAALVLARRARHAIAGFVAVLAVLVGLGDAGVLVHGYVISSLPASVVRGATAIAVGVGLISAACAARLLFGADTGPEARKLSASTPRRLTVPRERARTR
jgi:hypothetical protein